MCLCHRTSRYSQQILTSQKPPGVWSGWPWQPDRRGQQAPLALDPGPHRRGKRRNYLVWGRGLNKKQEKRKTLKKPTDFVLVENSDIYYETVIFTASLQNYNVI